MFAFLADIVTLPKARDSERADTGIERWRAAGAHAGESGFATALAANLVGATGGCATSSRA